MVAIADRLMPVLMTPASVEADVGGQNIAQQRERDAAQADQNDAAPLAEAHRHQHHRRVESRHRDFEIGQRVDDENGGRQRERGERQQRLRW